ncbi:MAG TPA: dihydrofolate reductase family protein [Candidatus Saccharimonadales bacterium]|nr:dihydrofolate reductase family protein [Candidatus Saccharimonadales bacterium]
MKITLVSVQSLDGKMTRGDDPHVHHWSSDEDFKQFTAMRDAHNLIVMGRRTYEAIRSTMHPRPGTLRVVLTSSPAQFAGESVPGSLEFTGESADALVARLENAGYSEMLLAGGGLANAAFLQAGLVTDLYVTIEPYLFGQGAEMVGAQAMDVRLKLESATQLNERGSLLLHYTTEAM